jgi:hypothetical protein
MRRGIRRAVVSSNVRKGTDRHGRPPDEAARGEAAHQRHRQDTGRRLGRMNMRRRRRPPWLAWRSALWRAQPASRPETCDTDSGAVGGIKHLEGSELKESPCAAVVAGCWAPHRQRWAAVSNSVELPHKSPCPANPPPRGGCPARLRNRQLGQRSLRAQGVAGLGFLHGAKCNDDLDLRDGISTQLLTRETRITGRAAKSTTHPDYIHSIPIRL